MKNTNDFKEEKFDSFLNKTIIMSSKYYFKKQMIKKNNESYIVDDEKYLSLLQENLFNKNNFDHFTEIDDTIELNKALESLSAIEQSVLFLLYKEELTQKEASEILDVYSKTISKIKIRAIDKLKKYMKGNDKNEK